jgi:dihydropteroate synthase
VGGLPQPGRCAVIGVLNVTPDSFSDGGRYVDVAAAVSHGLDLLADGADVIDVGGESTRPGAHRVSAADEIARVKPLVRALAELGAVVSIDTMHRETAEAALAAGARIVNDVSGGLADPRILDVVADSDATYVCMHWRAHSVHMNEHAVYDGPGGVVAAVCAELLERVDALHAAGVPDERIVLDPGLGFAKRSEHNWALLGGLADLQALGFRLLVGASRKSFLGTLLADPAGQPRPVDGREDATTALTVLVAQQHVWALRVHDVRASRDALLTLARWQEG